MPPVPCGVDVTAWLLVILENLFQFRFFFCDFVLNFRQIREIQRETTDNETNRVGEAHITVANTRKKRNAAYRDTS